MARTKKDPTEMKVTWRGFVNVYLNPQEKDYVKNHILSDAQIVEFIGEAAENGYKYSATYSRHGNFFTVTLYGNTPGQPNAGYAMSLRHADFATAVSALSFVVGEEGWKNDWTERFTAVGDNDW